MRLSLEAHLRLLKPPPPGLLRTVLDTDTFNEIDDQFALVQMALSKSRFDIEAIYAAPFHNKRSKSPADGMELSYEEILRLLERLEIPSNGLVHRGVTEYVGHEKRARTVPAVDDIVARARIGSPDRPLYIVAIGAISNVASALLAAPDIVDRVVVVWLGGHAFEAPHQREFNLRQDIGGAQVLFSSGVPLVLLPCRGVVSHLTSTIPEIERYVEPHGRVGSFLSSRFKDYAKNPVGWSKEIWDMAPVGWLINPKWAPSIITPTPILTRDATYSFNRSRQPMRYITRVSRDHIFRDFFKKLASVQGTTAAASA